jgi:leucyl aminopeptidase
MKITVRQGQLQNINDAALIVNLFAGHTPAGATSTVDKALDGEISALIKKGDFSGAKNKTLLLYSHGKIPAERVLLVGLGPQTEFNLETARQAAGTAVHALEALDVASATTVLHGSGAGGLGVEEAAQALTEASILAAYRFNTYRSAAKASPLKKLTIVEFDQDKITAARRGARNGTHIAAGTCLARDLSNHPGAVATPSYLATQARTLAKRFGLKCQVIDEAGMLRLGMGAILGVSRGSDQPARFIILEHNRQKGKQPLVFVGKGLTYDSGGLSLKTGEGLMDMKFDMCGAAAVMGAMQAVAALKLPQYIVGLIPASENMLNGQAVKPGDVLKTLSGKTIEVLNTDAEGRLILADALTYAARYKPAGVIDLATLTGACVIALGDQASGMFSNQPALADQVQSAGETCGERVWPLPLWPAYREQIKSEIADMKNIGGRPAGAITAATLLAEFVSYPWVHLDIAGTAWNHSDKPYISKGGVGVGTRLLVELARNWRAPV